MFRNDYCTLAADEVLEALKNNNGKQFTGYGLDEHSEKAASYILRDFGLSEDEAKVHFLLGGTQANMAVISYLLRPYEAVISCDTGHINVHETGAVEASGHKIIICPNEDGKLCPEDIDKQMIINNNEHLVKPAMVYITDSTETGTVYTASELLAIRKTCDKYGLLLFMDGARMGIALTCGADVDAKLIGSICDAFYVGGTKNGAMIGEAVVIKNKVDCGAFRYHIKNRGAMIGKGFMIGIQFETLFKDGLYYRLAKNSNDTAAYIREEFKSMGLSLIGGSNTNQIFVRFPRKTAEDLIERYGCELWTDEGESLVIRFVTSFVTTMEECKELIAYIQNSI